VGAGKRTYEALKVDLVTLLIPRFSCTPVTTLRIWQVLTVLRRTLAGAVACSHGSKLQIAESCERLRKAEEWSYSVW
jgi:hypothetical protein